MKKSVSSILFIFLVLFSISFTGCGASSDDTTDTPVNPLTADDLAGNWGNTDFVLDDAGDDESTGTDDDVWSKTLITFSNNTITYTDYDAIGADIDNLTATVTIQLTFTFTTGNTVATPAGSTEINLTQTSYMMTLHNAFYVAYANSTSMYGYNDWVIDVPKNVAGRTADGETLDDNGTLSYDVCKISGDILYLGDDEADPNYDGSTSSTRPRVLDSGWASLD